MRPKSNPVVTTGSGGESPGRPGWTEMWALIVHMTCTDISKASYLFFLLSLSFSNS